MRQPGELRPDEARDAAEFVAMLRSLKERSGLTFRQLEERAAGHGDVLARSTVADVLRRQTLPRGELVAALVRACGDGARLDAWLAARERLDAGGVHASEATLADAGPGAVRVAEGMSADGATAAPSRSVRPKPAPVLLAALGTAVVLAAGAWMLLPDGPGDQRARTGQGSAARTGSGAQEARTGPVGGTSSPSIAPPTATPDPGPAHAPGFAPAAGFTRIRPVRTPDLCMTEGRDRSGRESHRAIAVQRPCAQATPPRTYLKPLGDGLYSIQWHHPELGVGCLTVVAGGPLKDTLEPWDDCSAGRPAQHFRIEPVGASASEGYRLRLASGTDLCVGIRGDDTTASAEAVREPCTGKRDQVFLIGPGTGPGPG
ncbi:helix-turn-helix domain-containing protein [Streptomyces sp. 8N706]|uniref:helix-turn-helix domain-containing protein n=1 Tax=Streptomyces sp. 8N706 TaxID=3457416 RepID=UPI003FD04AEF